MYAVVGATGNTGRIIAENLLRAGQSVRVIGRSAERLQPLVEKGAIPMVLDVEDTAALTRAFEGTRAVYAMIAPNMNSKDFRAYQNKVGESISTAIRDAGVKYVVNLSSVGANTQQVGVVNGLYDQEQRLNKLEGVNVLHLRPGYFMENTLMQVDMIKNMNMAGSPVRGDLPIGMIATRDIGHYAARRLLELDFAGKSTQDLMGPEDITYQEVTDILSAALGKKNIPYVQFPYDQARTGMVQMGLSDDVSRLMVELSQSVNEGICVFTETRSKANTTPTSYKEFIKMAF